VKTKVAAAREKINSRIFKAVHGRNLIYNTCWEDPALDRVALEFEPADRVVVITSAGCNALDYLLAGAGEVNAVDVNPIQNALLELKKTAALHLDHDSFFALFGDGGTPAARGMYHDAIRRHLSHRSRTYWDRRISFFDGGGWRSSFYYRGTSGLVAKLFMMHVHLLHRLRKPLEALLAASSVEEQKEIYESRIRSRIWTRWLRWMLRRSLTMSLLGVPGPQRAQITNQYPGGVPQFVRDCIEAVLTKLPFRDNYFWRVYLQGQYTPECCPEYLKKENFDRLKASLPRLHIHTMTVTEFLRRTTPGVSKFILLDHMDWMSSHHPEALAEEWNAILAAARPGARVIYRSAGLHVDYLDHLRVSHRGKRHELGTLLRRHPELTAALHQRDRVHTYGSFHRADLPDDCGV
jgi:S-adenosylmethionine-diacylglycerol 3-amino-3-carboxypropyl transferase